MPYGVRYDKDRKGKKWVTYNTRTGDVKGTHETKAGAERQRNLLEGLKHGWKPTGKKARR